MSLEALSVNMKTTLALIVSWMVFLIVGGLVALLAGPFDIYIVLSMLILVPYAVFFWYCRKRKRWAYLGSVVLGIILVAAIPASIDKNITPLLLWETAFSTILLALISLEGYKGYLELAGKP